MRIDRSELYFPGAIIQGLATFYEEQGSSLLPSLLEELQISEEELWSEDFKFDGNQALILLRRMDNLNSDTPVLEAIRLFSWSSTGVVGLAALSSATLEDAIEVGLNYGHIYMPAIKVEIVNRPERSRILFSLLTDFEDMNARAIELIMCGFKKVGEEISGSMSDCSMHFSHACSTGQSDEEASRVYSEKLGCEVLFGSDFTGLSATQSFWQRPLVNPNKVTRTMALNILKQQYPRQASPETLGDRARNILKKAADQGIYLSLMELGEILHMTPRTVMRKLSAEDLRYKDLINEIRFNKAKQMLTKTDASLIKIAEEVGFKDSNAFIRAFKRYFGITPSNWRKQQ